MTHQWLVCGCKAYRKRRNLDGGRRAKKHRLPVNSYAPPANVWHPLQLRLWAQGGHLAVKESKTISKLNRMIAEPLPLQHFMMLSLCPINYVSSSYCLQFYKHIHHTQMLLTSRSGSLQEAKNFHVHMHS